MKLGLTGALLSSSVLFPLYLQFYPKLGNVWIRQNDIGKRELNLRSLLQFYTLPVRSLFVYDPCFWDLNWLFWGISGFVFGSAFDNFFLS